MKTNIIVNLRFEAVHCWENCDIKEVMFLKYLHRHVFHATCKKEVEHSDRDIEFICLKRKIKSYTAEVYNGNLGGMSCEMIAEDLLQRFNLSYCSVLEDGENGAEVIK